MTKHATMSLIVLATLSAAPLSYADQQGHSPSGVNEVRQKAGDAAESIRNYSVDKRNEAAKKAKAALDVLDSRIDALEMRIYHDWEKMDKAGREQARQTMEALHQKRVEVAEWYGGLKYSTAHSWEHMKHGFVDAYKSLRNKSEDAERDYRDGEKK
jgi:hypothetical protein